MVEQLTLDKFLSTLSSKEPVPGGGGASALAGALGNALGQMVANLTIGKKRYADVEDEIKGLLARMEDLQKEFVILADRDEEVFAPLAAAYGLPTGTEEEKAHKAAVMEQRLLDASYVPLEVMEKAVEMLMEAVKAVRARRSEMNVPPSKKAHLTIATQEADIFTAGIPFLKRLGYASQVTVTGPAGLGSDKEEAAKGVVTVITHAARIGMPLAELVDLEKEKARIAKELKKNRGELEKLSNKLNNPGFLAKAPEQVVAAEKERAEKLTALIAQLEAQEASL